LSTNLTLDHTESLTLETRAWCDQQMSLLHLPEPPRSTNFMPGSRNEDGTFYKRIPPWFDQLVYTARAWYLSGSLPELAVAPKPRDGWGFTVRQEVLNAMQEQTNSTH
jgi:hypothetical protein